MHADLILTGQAWELTSGPGNEAKEVFPAWWLSYVTASGGIYIIIIMNMKQTTCNSRN